MAAQMAGLVQTNGSVCRTIVRNEDGSNSLLAPLKIDMNSRIVELEGNKCVVQKQMQTVAMGTVVTLIRTGGETRIINGNYNQRKELCRILRKLAKLTGRNTDCTVTIGEQTVPNGLGFGISCSVYATVVVLANATFGLGFNVPRAEYHSGYSGVLNRFFVVGGRATLDHDGRLRRDEDQYEHVRLHYLIAVPNNKPMPDEQWFRFFLKERESFNAIAAKRFPDVGLLLSQDVIRNAVEFGASGNCALVYAGYESERECKEAECNIRNLFTGELYSTRSLEPFFWR